VNFDAGELPPLLGRSTRELAKQLGTAYEREVVHRDDLVVLRHDHDSAEASRGA
jgi:glutamate 5-kinase